MTSKDPAEILKTEDEKDLEAEASLHKWAEEQEEAANILRRVAARMERLSEDMRKMGAFPLADQLDRDRVKYERTTDAIPNGR